jgi:hypothetical protein
MGPIGLAAKPMAPKVPLGLLLLATCVPTTSVLLVIRPVGLLGSSFCRAEKRNLRKTPRELYLADIS